MCADLFQEVDELCTAKPEQVPADTEQAFMILSSVAAFGSPAPRTMQFKGSLGGKDLLIRVDSGSSHSFLSSAFAQDLPNLKTLARPMTVRVADGGTVVCTAELQCAEWIVQGHSFHSSLRILQLGSFDMIVGMDWLEAFSPMKVDWRCKWMSIPHGPSHVLLQGLLPNSDQSPLLHLCHIASSTNTADSPIPPPIQELLVEFAHLFEEPSDLPPRRQCDHQIPLIPGAPPVAVRQYRYKPALKDEIEKQVAEMLQSGLVQPSSNSFSSPVLLVRKKDGSWRFCVDYRMLNAITVKSKFPIPVIDELLDELSEAKWFSCLDLRAGFNQIRLAPSEEHKTAFQTHWG